MSQKKLYTEEQVIRAIDKSLEKGYLFSKTKSGLDVEAIISKEKYVDPMAYAMYTINKINRIDILDSLTPITLPSDEEIDKYLKSFPYTKHLDDGQYNDGVIDGAELGIEWLKNKIQGGNK